MGSSRDWLAALAIILGSTILFLAISILLVATALLALNIGVSSLPFFLGSLVGMACCWYLTKSFFERARKLAFIAILSCLSVALLASIYVSGFFYDLSWDGQTYHQPAIIQLAEGWNPIYDPERPKDLSHSTNVIHYPKAPWINAAVVYKLTGTIEDGKAFNLLMILASFLLSSAALLTFKRLPVPVAATIGFLLAANPVSVSQMFSYYVDGQLGSLLVSMGSVLVLLYRRPPPLISTTLGTIVILVVNTKPTGVFYALLFFGGFFAWFKLREKKTLGLLAFVASFLLGSLVIGYNPYVYNTATKGNPFYPVVGAATETEWRYRLEISTPEDFRRMDNFEKLFRSIFSRSQGWNEPSQLKLPFTVSRDELTPFSFPDARVGGFGPLFGGGMILAGVILALSLRTHFRNAVAAGAVVLLVATSAVAIGEGWWARFAPQVWTIPLIAAALPMTFERKRNIATLLACILVAVLFVNVLLISGFYVRNHILYNLSLREQFASISQMPQPVEVDYSDFLSNKVRFEKLGIKYTVADSLSCPEPQSLLLSPVRVCPTSSLSK